VVLFTDLITVLKGKETTLNGFVALTARRVLGSRVEEMKILQTRR
jgi:hypothetical protein